MFNIIDRNKIESFTKEELINLYPSNLIKKIELLYQLDCKINLISNELLLDYQNTNSENFPFILKDFINSVNKSSNIIIDTIIDVLRNCKEIIVDKPSILEHPIQLNEKTSILESVYIKNSYITYLNEVNKKALIVRNYLKSINSNILVKFEYYSQFDNNRFDEINCLLTKEGDLKDISEENIFNFNKFQAKREAIVLNLGDEIKKILSKNRVHLDINTIEALEFFSYRAKEEYNNYFNELYYSVNLYDEKVIEKKSQIFFYETKNEKFEIVGNDVISENKKSTSWTYSFVCNFNIDYYIKKYMIEQYTKKDMFSFMCLYKDYLSNYNYLNFCNKNEFNQKHPMIIEANLLHEVNTIAKRFNDRLKHYDELIEQTRMSNKDLLIITKSVYEWMNILKFPEATKKIFINKFLNNQEPTIDDISLAIKDYGNKIIENEIGKVLNTEEKEKNYSNIKRDLKFIDEVINNIFYKLYYIDLVDEESNGSEINRHFSKRDRATFQTTLKESLVFDLRNDRLILSDNIKTLINEDKVSKIVELMKNHKYHDYLEIDKEAILKSCTLSLDDIIIMLEKINLLNIPVPQKCALKFRKLGNYKASGIYFSFSKQLGVDYRIGMSSYIHELAHHIDLNTDNQNRNIMLLRLHEYFDFKIENRREYYLKNEELIARAAEVSMILLLGRYDKYKEFYDKGEINGETLYNAVISAFKKHKFSNFMGEQNNYENIEYINIKDEILNNNFEFLEFILIYFKCFWGGKEIPKNEIKRFSSHSLIEYTNENKFVKKNEYSYKRFYRRLFESRITY